MELWIRSRDKRVLLCAKMVWIGERQHIVADTEVVGTYDTEQRCLEILEEIQKLLFSPTQIVINKCNVDEEEYDRLCKQLKTNGVACLPSDSKVEYLDKDWVLYEMPEK